MFLKPKKKYWTTGIAPYYKAAGGGSPVPTALYSDTQSIGYGSTTYTAPAQSWPAGMAVVYLYDETNRNITSPKIGSTTLNEITPNTGGHIYYGVIPAGSASFICTGDFAFGEIGSIGYYITGGSSTTPDGSSNITVSSAHPDPQTGVTGTVPTGGCGICFIGAQSGTNMVLPATWSNMTRDVVTESHVTTGNGITVAGSHTLTAGSITPSVSGYTGGGQPNGFGYSSPNMGIICFGP